MQYVANYFLIEKDVLIYTIFMNALITLLV